MIFRHHFFLIVPEYSLEGIKLFREHFYLWHNFNPTWNECCITLSSSLKPLFKFVHSKLVIIPDEKEIFIIYTRSWKLKNTPQQKLGSLLDFRLMLIRIHEDSPICMRAWGVNVCVRVLTRLWADVRIVTNFLILFYPQL